MDKDTPTPFEDALEKTGNGPYNMLLVLTCGLILLAIGVDLFGFGLVVAAACDLNITVSQKGILTSLPYIGILLVSYFWGYISDTRGRRFSLIVSVQGAFVLSCLASVATNWLFLGLIKFFSVCLHNAALRSAAQHAMSGIWLAYSAGSVFILFLVPYPAMREKTSCAANSATYTLVGESCPKGVRSKYMLLMTCLLILSPAVGALMTYPVLSSKFEIPISILGINFTPWRLLIIVLTIPLGIGGIAICFFHESPKFLANCGRRDDAMKVLKSIHAVNNRSSKETLQVTSLYLEDATSMKSKSLFQALYEQNVPLFKPPMLWRTLQLFFIVGVVYITNNSLLVWLPYMLNLAVANLNQNSTITGDICTLLSTDSSEPLGNTTNISPEICLGYIENNVIITLVAAQSVYAFLTFVISYLMSWRRIVLLFILSISTLSGILLGWMPEPVSSVFLFMVFTCTNLGMGILASYFVDLYPTSCRGMVQCLSIMVGRTSTFIGINIVGNLIFYHCRTTFYMWSLLVFSSVVAAWFLPRDKQTQS